MSNYEQETLNAYRTIERAKEYKKYHTKDLSWARISTWQEQRLVARELSKYKWTQNDTLLDIPCGTGILGKLLYSFPFKIVASDISPEMMTLAKEEYPNEKLISTVQADITNTKFESNRFDCVVVLGFIHRVPKQIRKEALFEIARVSKKVVLLNCSVDSASQRFKMRLISLIWRKHIPAPSPVAIKEIIQECENAGFKVVRSFMVIPFLSAKAILVLEKTGQSNLKD